MKQTYIFCLLFLSLFSSAQNINFPDPVFKAELLEASTSNTIAKNLSGNYFKIDANSDGQIQQSEALNVSYLDVGYSTYDIANLTGIEYFINLTDLDCASNLLTSLNFSSNTALVNLDCAGNELTSLNLSNNLLLETLNCNDNSLTTLNLSGLTELITVYSNGNDLTSLNVSNCSSLITLTCSGNNLASLNLTGLSTLQFLVCGANVLNSLSLTGCSSLIQIYCEGNQLSNLNLNGLNALELLYCGVNLFQIIDISNLPALNDFSFNSNSLLTAIFMSYNGLNQTDFNDNVDGGAVPNLSYICIEDARQSMAYSYFGINSGIEINSYCSFVPSNPFYVIQGNNRLDSNNNGCDTSDFAFPFFKLKIVNSSITRNYISGFSGNYYIPVASGVNIVTPVLENPTYFNVSPSSINISFPTQTSPYTQNFCLTANGVHPDLEVVLLPLNQARPGFDAKYKIIYKNKGNTAQSGAINLTFNDPVLDLVSSNPVISNQSANNLSWNFTNLLPFESREISFTLNLNSPMETPAVNSGDILNYTTTVTSALTDDLPNDNTFLYNQTVVNSLDPNDKTCLEGNTITPAKVGDYVHYIIRFENTGTFAAENVVIKDMIDIAKFDINSFVAMNGSHPFVTRITGTNKLEFIFENINLPFDDANNDGYVAFKIKTKPTLVVGNTFSNSANIYFDYNFPIVTNTATTTIAALSNPSFEFANYFSLYPNPTTNELNINLKSAIEIHSIQIYNTIGQLVTVQTGNALKVDVSSLKTGNYFIKINTNEGFSTSQFIKE